MKIKTIEEYNIAKARFAKLFHADTCQTDYKESQTLMKALDEYEATLKVEN